MNDVEIYRRIGDLLSEKDVDDRMDDCQSIAGALTDLFIVMMKEELELLK